VTLLELTFGVLAGLFGRKRLLAGGALMLGLGEPKRAVDHNLGRGLSAG
jgi:hypothetical protein